jgi:2-methylisocitrate lyase-like PEP mutase family enzyme
MQPPTTAGEALRRDFLYAEAGADMLDIEVPGTPDEVAAIKAAPAGTAQGQHGRRQEAVTVTSAAGFPVRPVGPISNGNGRSEVKP